MTNANIELKISGMTCQACATRLEKVLNKKEAVSLAEVNFATETANIQLNQEIAHDEILTWVKKTGFTGEVIDNSHDDLFDDTSHKKEIPYRLIGLFVLSIPFWVGMVGMMIGSHALMPPVWVQFVLATLAQVLGVGFYRGAWVSIKSGVLGMDVLVSLGTTAIWAYSTYMWATHPHALHHVYFEASVMILSFVSLGKYLEHRTKTGSLNAQTHLLKLLPHTVKKQTGDKWADMPLSSVSVGDTLMAHHGDKVAVDGVITSGQGDITQAHLTGESQYIARSVGDTVLAGSVVADGSFAYRATATGRQTALGQMTDALAHAQGTKAPIARLADRVAGVFVPVVVVLSLLTLAGNFYILGDFETALMRAVAVLVIACPCALGLATPTAIMAGMGVASRHGVQFLDASALEMTGQVRAMAFDKTGTLTSGQLSVVDKLFLPNPHLSENDLLAITTSLESHSKHPLALAICQYVNDMDNVSNFSPNNIKSTAGQGIQADIDDVGVVKVGTLDFVGKSGGELDDFAKNHPTASLVFVGVNDNAVGVFALADTVKADAHKAIELLKKDDIKLVILSGDRQSVVDNVANSLVIDGVGGLTPNDKSLKIKELQRTHKTAMIGDGINDALAMTTADIGMAVGGATDVATGSASVRLIADNGANGTKSGAMSIYHAHKIAQLTLSNIKQNLFFAFIYNSLGIPLAMMGVLNPMIASIAMALSSLSVLANAMRLTGVDLTKQA